MARDTLLSDSLSHLTNKYLVFMSMQYEGQCFSDVNRYTRRSWGFVQIQSLIQQVLDVATNQFPRDADAGRCITH